MSAVDRLRLAGLTVAALASWAIPFIAGVTR